MHLELRHLRTVQAIHEQGGLARAAEVLNITQSALSHQVKALEQQAGVELFVRRAKPMRLSAAGMRVLRLAEQVLPMVAATEAEFKGVEAGRIGRLHIAMECHACFDWLLPVLDIFRRAWPDVDVDIRQRLAFGALPALAREEVDLVISSDPEDVPGVIYQPLFDYAPTLVVPAGHPLTIKGYADPRDLADETLITYPMERARLDVFSQFLTPAGIEPARQRTVELTAVSLMLVASRRGVAVMPDWVLRRESANPDIAMLPLGPGGILRRLYAAIREEDLSQPYMAHVLRLSRTEPLRMLRGSAS
ncbi:MAG: LysR family transcriptional regulator [Paracoccus sp. (in: a-proteobacteria)]|jgi:LysR family transcriptional regulator for metE and metH|uniref:LysR family transcriptional regulator n=1 Tax=unclassified Paracoccus (in: a-proteobacteria) TaxID=2688777 RepID=UPI000C389906|nr:MULTISPECIES: LysR family transcriptional regulator [unclassified Paracoccus (in: a-proteobacteria)]MBA50322.1 LysR family transcriptional regulator [Paracoccus sp. (in: a-proteobacteria)]|tara:strand:- start:1898 stop:2812 length:915 start_codon:yes stop_codon:yes gene_type:complete